MARSWTLARSLALVAVVSTMSLEQVAAQAAPADPDWPCVQRLLPEIAGGMVWAGPPLDTVETGGDDRTVEALAKDLAARRVPVEEAERRIEDFASDLADDRKPETLTALFKTTLEIINDDRASIINGIKKFSRGQQALADKINARNLEIQEIESSDVLARDAAVAERDWDIRIFEERRQSLTYLCEQPVLLEQRAFALARSMAGHID